METDKKICGMCAEEIGINAKRCPFCRTWQNKMALFLHHPVTNLILVIIPVILGYLVMAFIVADLTSSGEPFESHKNEITIKNSELKFGENKCGGQIIVLGEIENNSSFTWEELKFEAVFYDQNGEKIDSGQDSDYFFMIPKNATTPYKLSFKRDLPEEKFSTFKVRILAGKEMKMDKF